MKITLNEKDIKTAILQFLGGKLTLANTPVVELSMKGRGGADGMEANIDLDGIEEELKAEVKEETKEESSKEETDALFGSEEPEPKDPDTSANSPFGSFA